ncbi:uncharacterized protein LOC113754120 isoform X1 [Coffea eugenioides]|uniref:Uncharacterized protein isoform X2 n=1 Tax=Coffea arabica TaxID=13443 RepID=A0A6P6VD05_COFAR|nr:uncharacterized protein LOC113719060 isoform X1 [Coffea arabica]XP_027154261.1 uncharacterized protein LOC113754120 isoform X1 [Coffea eugenioides]
MEVVTLNCCWKSRPYNLSASVFQPLGMEFVGPRNSAEMSPARFFSGFRVGLRVFASRNSVKKSRKKEKSQKYDTSPSNKAVLEENDAVSNTPPLADNYIQENSNTSSFNHSEGQSTLLIPSRGAVLRACTITSCLIGTLGVVIRQVSHFASTKGWPVIDASSEISLNFETWHLELIVGLVILISSCRYLLLNIWLDFAESSEAANKQVLSSLEPSDYIVVAFLPGISEELLFRGALLPLFGMDWKSVFAVAALFGILHLGSGRKYSFAVWAMFVGLAYGYATVVSSSIIVPMASHAMNNLVGGIMGRYTSKSSK